MKSPAHRALDEQLALIRYVTSDENRRWSEFMVDKSSPWAEGQWRTQQYTLHNARTFFIDAAMMDLLESAAEALPVGTTPKTGDLFVPDGFAWFARPIRLPVNGWQGPYPPGFEQATEQIIGGLMWAGPENDAGRVALTAISAIPAPPRFFTSLSDWPIDDPLNENLLHWSQRTSYALNALLAQHIVSLTNLEPTRDQVHRMGRNGLPPEFGTIALIHLRRYRDSSKSDADPTPADYSHRFIVHGHWRNHWFPTLNDHRLIWINDYVKGPEDRPLIVKDPLYWLHR